MTPEIQLTLGLLTLAGVIAGGIIAGRYAERKARIEAEASPYELLMKRVVEVEKTLDVMRKQIADLRAESQTDRDYIRRVVPWVTAHKDLATWLPPDPPTWFTNN